MKKLLLALFIIGIVFASGCVNPLTDNDIQNDAYNVFNTVERYVPVPDFLSPYFTSNQEVPLNNIPNADMENWSVGWTTVSGSGSTGYSGDYFFEGSSKYIMANKSGCGYVSTYNTTSPLFSLKHDYISFYAYNIWYGGVCQGNSNFSFGVGTGYFTIYNSSGELILKKKIIDMSTSYVNPYYGSSPPDRTSPFSTTYSKGTFTGDDGRTWYLLTIPIPSYLVGQDVSYGFELGGTPYGPITPYIYIDNFYYSNSNGDEIYALEAPTAQFTYVVNGYDVTVDAGISQTVGTLYQIKWNWGDGTLTEGVTSAHKYTFPGNKQITLTIMDNENLIDTATLVVSVDGTSYYTGPEGSNTPKIAPVAGFSYGITGMTIDVDGKYSTDDGVITLYSWDFDGVKKNGQTASYTYLTSGSKTVTLTVTDNVGLEGTRKITFNLPVGGMTQSTIVVDNPGTPPTAKFTYTFSTPTITVDASGSSDDVKIETYSWNWGDGSTSVGKTSTHTYSDMGTGRTIVLTVTDNEGFSDSVEVSIVTQSYNTPIVTDDDDDVVVTPPPVISGNSNPSGGSSGGTSTSGFPLWGAVVTLIILCAIVALGMFLFGGKKKGKPLKFGKKGGRKR